MTTTAQAGATEQQAPAKRDFRKEVTDNIVRLLENGVAPWQKPWQPGQGTAIPVNPTTASSIAAAMPFTFWQPDFRRITVIRAG